MYDNFISNFLGVPGGGNRVDFNTAILLFLLCKLFIQFMLPILWNCPSVIVKGKSHVVTRIFLTTLIFM